MLGWCLTSTLKKHFCAWKFFPNFQNGLQATFPLGFRCKIFKKNFGPKMHEKTLEVLENPFRTPLMCIWPHLVHTMSRKKFAQNGHIPTNAKIGLVCLVGAHTWGGARAKQSTIPYLHAISILASNSSSIKSHVSSKYGAKMQFLWWPYFKALYFSAVKHLKALGRKSHFGTIFQAQNFFPKSMWDIIQAS